MMLLAVLILAVLAMLPLRPLLAGGWRARVSVAALGLFAMACVIATLVWDPVAKPQATNRAIVVHEVGYVGSQSCRSCHPGEHASWHQSFHRTMTQVCSREALAMDFERLQLDWFGKTVVLEWRGEQLWTIFNRGGSRPGRVERAIVQLTGSHHLQVLWYSTGEQRELAPVPMCFKIEEGIWIPLSTVFVLPPEFRDPPDPGVWNKSCTMCHTTDARPRVDIGRTDTEVSEFGVSCEACHGPGAEHVAANHNPVRRYAQRLAGEDATIVNPGTLKPVRSAEVCGHCHSVSILKEQHFDSWREHGSPFLPGEDLQNSHLVIGVHDGDAPELRRELLKNRSFFKSSFWSDGQVRLAGREFSGLRRSPCYTHGDGARQIDCTSCHRMHPDRTGQALDRSNKEGDWREDQLARGMRGNVGCTQCHEQLASDEGLQAHTYHAPDSLGSNCYNCHMSHTSIGLMKASRSHQITSPDVAAELATGRPNACNQCHLDRSLAWTAEHLEKNWGITQPPLSIEQREVSASVRWLLSGDASQRLLAAWSFGWQPAQQTSGTDWLAPFLGRLLDDPYYVVRFNAARSLRTLGGYGGVLVGYDFVRDAEVVQPFVDNIVGLWQSRYGGGARAAILMGERGLLRDRFQRLYARRDDRPVYIAE